MIRLAPDSMLLGFSLAVGVFCVAGADIVLAAAEIDDEAPELVRSPSEVASATNYVAGDKLKVKVFENLNKSADDSQLLGSLVERTELTGEYTVDQNGNVTFPFIGEVNASDMAPSAFEHQLEEEYSRVLGGQLRVVVQLSDRQPVYVAGPQAAPFVVKFVPGMVALQALAFSGSLDRIAADNSVRIDVWRERERMTKSEQSMIAALARLEVLSAEKKGITPTPSPELLSLAGQESASSKLDGEVKLRQAELNERNGEISSVDSSIEAAKKEQELLQERLKSSEADFKEKLDYVQALEAAHARGALSELTFHQGHSELASARDRWDEIRLSITQLDSKLTELMQQKNRLATDDEVRRAREIKELSAIVAENRLTQSSIESLVHSFADFRLIGPQDASLTILRNGPSGRSRISADGLSALQPGDILEVGVSDSGPPSKAHVSTVLP